MKSETEKREWANEYARDYYKNYRFKEERKEQMREYARQKRLEKRRNGKDYIYKLESKNNRQKLLIKDLENRIDQALILLQNIGFLNRQENIDRAIDILEGQKWKATSMLK